MDPRPVANDITQSTPANTAVTFTLTAKDPENKSLKFFKQGNPTNGTLDFKDNGQVTYTPNPCTISANQNCANTDVFYFVAFNGIWNTDNAKITINVQPSTTPAPSLFARTTPLVADDKITTTNKNKEVIIKL